MNRFGVVLVAVLVLVAWFAWVGVGWFDVVTDGGVVEFGARPVAAVNDGVVR